MFISGIQMVLISGGEFLMGTDDPGIPADGEGPQRPVYVDSFYMDVQEVTNQQFQSFVRASGYVTEVLYLKNYQVVVFYIDSLKQLNAQTNHIRFICL